MLSSVRVSVGRATRGGMYYMDGRRPEPRQHDEQSQRRTTEAGKQTDNGQGLTIFLPLPLSRLPLFIDAQGAGLPSLFH
jgi:hypothetical protein